MKSPTAVAIRASATPPVTPRGSTRPSEPKRWNARTMPVIVPSRPKSGAAVTMVSRIHSQRPSDCSIRVASSAALDSTHHAGRCLFWRITRKKRPKLVLRPEPVHALLEVVPREVVGLEQLQQRRGYAAAGREHERLLQDHHHGHDRQ